MSKIEDFLSLQEEEQIIAAIRKAESHTSGEIRVHIEKHTEIDAYERAMEVFHFLKMDTTKLRNGVLIYLAIDDKNFVIFGDQGINDVVANDFWDSTRDIMLDRFKSGDFKQGLIEGILKAGQQLETHFPWEDLDKNELPNRISKG
ncbi:MAG: TPM domain-containing protein [Flavobacteriaceae bacterium]|nr:TPM domain-containing protein [Flavobacteriaceae bacterium]